MSAFADQVALVTGGRSGIGEAIARRLSAGGATLALVARTGSALQAVAGQLPRARAFACDMGDEHAVRRLAEAVLGEFGRVDILVHNAAAYVAAPVEQAALSDLDLQWSVNVRGPFLLTQLLLPGLRRQGGQVLFMNSSAGVASHANVSQYAATKFALKAVADALREEVGPQGVRVISVFPGRTATPLQEQIMRREGRGYQPDKLLQPDDVAAAAVHALSLPRTATITDLHIRPSARHP
jgi:NADP-dependent 3-hydroxy acid dehydrogenase YdfG